MLGICFFTYGREHIEEPVWEGEKGVDLRFADFITDTELIRQARALAGQVLKEDPDLTGHHANLRPFISESAAPQGAH